MSPRYMTNGVIVALGDVGRNVAAGMSGGILYLYQALLEVKTVGILHNYENGETYGNLKTCEGCSSQRYTNMIYIDLCCTSSLELNVYWR